MRSAPRYLVPILPIAFFYAVVGAQFAIEKFVPVQFRSTTVNILLAGLVLYLAGYYLTLKRVPTPGIHTPQSAQLFNVVRTKLPKDAVVIFRKPRAMALLGQRRSAVWAQRGDERTAWQNMAELGATHLVIPRKEAGLDCPAYLRYDLLASPPAYLERVFANDHFTIYRIARFPREDETRGDRSLH
jgi:hypothetical protein